MDIISNFEEIYEAKKTLSSRALAEANRLINRLGRTEYAQVCLESIEEQLKNNPALLPYLIRDLVVLEFLYIDMLNKERNEHE